MPALGHLRSCLVFAVLFLPACAHQAKVNSLAEGLEAASAQQTLEILRDLDPPSRDRVRYLLNLGTLELITGDFEHSIDSLQEAKLLLAELQAVSVTETLGAATVNENIRSYDSAPNERVLLSELLVLSYLLLGDLEAARVEVLQADVLMRELAKSDSLHAQLASMHFLSGVVFELTGELDDAAISYRLAANILMDRERQIPSALRDSLLLLSYQRGEEEELLSWAETFGHEFPAPAPGEAQLIVFYWDGVVTSKDQHFISVYVPDLEQFVSVALPYYPASDYLPSSLGLDAAGHTLQTQPLEDVEILAREDLASEAALIYAVALARVVAKVQMVDTVQEQNEFAGMIANLTAMITEIADTRSWNMLPSTIQVARVSLPPGEVWVRMAGGQGNPEAVVESSVTLSAGEITVLLASNVSKRFLTFTHTP